MSGWQLYKATCTSRKNHAGTFHSPQSVQLIVFKNVDKERRAITLHGRKLMICLSVNFEKLVKSGTDDVLKIRWSLCCKYNCSISSIAIDHKQCISKCLLRRLGEHRTDHNSLMAIVKHRYSSQIGRVTTPRIRSANMPKFEAHLRESR